MQKQLRISGNHLSICLKTEENHENPFVEMAGHKTFRIHNDFWPAVRQTRAGIPLHKWCPESQGIRDQFAGDPWINFCNGYYEACFFYLRNNVLLKVIEELI